jgi:hypothetical protein
MAKRFCEGFEAALGAIADGLSRPRTEKRIGRLKEKAHSTGQHYHIELQTDESGTIATAPTWTKQAEERADGHLFITVLAYQLVQIIRRCLKESGIDLSWNSIRRIMAGQCRVTASFRRADGRASPACPQSHPRRARAIGYLSCPKP